jgi:hypothetical protein
MHGLASGRAFGLTYFSLSEVLATSSGEDREAEKQPILLSIPQSDFCSAALPPDSVTNIPIGHSGKILTSGLLPTSRLQVVVSKAHHEAGRDFPNCAVGALPIQL